MGTWLAIGASISPAIAVEPGLPSKTSVVAATLRAIGAKHPDAELRNPDFLAIKLLGPAERAIVEDFPTDALDLDFDAAVQRLSAPDRGSVTTMNLRTKHIDKALDDALGDRVRQVIILGAGLDSRGYRFRERSRGVRFLEVDYGPTQEYKKQRVKDLFGKLPSEVRYVPMDFTKDDLLSQLRTGGYSEKERSFFIWEGVSMYLPEAAVRQTLRFVREHAAPNSTLVFDYATASDPNVNNPGSRFARMGEPWIFGFPGVSAEHLLRQERLSIVSDHTYPDLIEQYGLRRQPKSGSSFPVITGDQKTRRICIARVDDGPR
ncbi:MAG TPA: SAM-dependent methyltransferase [Bryobacteraceae bacterium]|nr:SAM-dependent methyltransferase [Bryobacteraceae bacterium]